MGITTTNNPDNLEVLCANCHFEHHQKTKDNQEKKKQKFQ